MLTYRSSLKDACIIDEQIQGAKPGCNALKKVIYLTWIGYVYLRGMAVYLVCYLLCFVRGQIGNHDARAFYGQSTAQCSA